MIVTSRTSRHRRGVSFLEYALSLPLIIVMIFLTIDIGRIVMMSTALHEAVTVGARAGARTGYVGGVPGRCETAGITGETTYDALCEVARNIPGGTVSGITISSPTTGAPNRYCRNGAGTANLYVTVSASLTNLQLLTPGLGSLLTAVNSQNALPGALVATGSARCEVARA